MKNCRKLVECSRSYLLVALVTSSWLKRSCAIIADCLVCMNGSLIRCRYVGLSPPICVGVSSAASALGFRETDPWTDFLPRLLFESRPNFGEACFLPTSICRNGSPRLSRASVASRTTRKGARYAAPICDPREFILTKHRWRHIEAWSLSTYQER